MASADQMPPWRYSDGFWGNLLEVVFPHQWLAARTAGKDLAESLNGAATAGADANETGHYDVTENAAQRISQLSSGASASKAASAGLTMAADTAASQVKRRHGLRGRAE